MEISDKKETSSSIIANTDSYSKCWEEHLLRMDGSQISNSAFEYNPTGRKDVRHPRKRWAL
jgi:hypothetical protein